jgi:hypothetical protein
MTAVLHRFPTTAAFMAQREAEARRIEAITAARAVLRSAANHDDAILIEACSALQTWGDGTDWLEADAMLMAIRIRARRRAADAAKAEATRGTIRAALVDCAGLAVIVALALAVYLVGGW